MYIYIYYIYYVPRLASCPPPTKSLYLSLAHPPRFIFYSFTKLIPSFSPQSIFAMLYVLPALCIANV